MFTASEKKYLALTLVFLVVGSGIKIYRRSQVHFGPFPDAELLAADSIQVKNANDLLAGRDSLGLNDSSTQADSLPKSSVPHGEVSKLRTGGAIHPEYHSKAAFKGKVSLNQAGVSDLTQIKGIGEKTAEAIVEFRNTHGRFGEIGDLTQVKGIGEKKLEKIMPFLIL